MMADENYWLENERIETDRSIRSLVRCFLLCDFLCLRLQRRDTWWDETQIQCQNKQEIYQSPVIVILSRVPSSGEGDKCEIRQVHYQTIVDGNNDAFQLLIYSVITSIWMETNEMSTWSQFKFQRRLSWARFTSLRSKLTSNHWNHGTFACLFAVIVVGSFECLITSFFML